MNDGIYTMRDSSVEQSAPGLTAPRIPQGIKTAVKACLRPFPRLNRLTRAYLSYYARNSELRYLRHVCRPNEFSIDVGAAWGAVSYWMARYSAGVVLLEPNPYFHSHLQKCFKGDRFALVPAAASSRPGHTRLVIPAARIGRSTIDDANTAHVVSAFADVKTVDVPVVTLDELSRERVGFIKIDVEGHEFAVLQGSDGLLRRCRPNLLVEIEERHHEGSFVQVYEYLAERGYRCAALRGGRFQEIDPEMFAHIQERPGSYVNNFVFSVEEPVFRALRVEGAAVRRHPRA